MTTTDKPTYVAIADDAPELDGATGVQIMWNLHGLIEIDALVEATERAGLETELLPRRPTPSMRVRRAVHSVSSGPRSLMLPHPKGGFVIVTKGETDDHELDLRTGVHAWTEGTRKESVLRTNRDEDDPTARAIRERYAFFAEVYTTEDIGLWLPKLIMGELGGTALRESGGVYFIPAQAVPTWHRWATVLRSLSSHRLYDDIRLLPTEGAMQLILDSIQAEATKAVETIAGRLDGVKTKRGFVSKQRELDAVLAKLASYERLLGTPLDTIRSRAKALHRQAGESMLELLEDVA